MKNNIFRLLIVLAVISSAAMTVAVQVPAQASPGAAAPTPGAPDYKVYMPIMVRDPGYSVSGTITDKGGQPLSGVSVVDQQGRTVTTDSGGSYTMTGLPGSDVALAPAKAGYVFAPAMLQLDPANQNSPQNFDALQACTDVAVNGGFETDAAWQLPVTPYPAAYTTSAAHTGLRSLRTGILTAADNRLSYSSGRQLISIPAGTVSVALRLWLYPVSTEAATASLAAQPSSPLVDNAELASDIQYVLVLDPGPNPDDPADDTLLETLMWMRSNDQQWASYEFNLTKYAGKSIKIQVGTYNDGFGGVTAMYVDDVVVDLCDTPPAPVPGPTPGCSNYFANPGFEATGSWKIPVTTYPASYTVAQAHAGAQSMRTGIGNPAANQLSYSDAYQVVSIPSTATSASLGLWVYRVTSEIPTESFSSVPAGLQPGELYGKAPLTVDSQYVLVLNQAGYILEVLDLWKKNQASWQFESYDLSKYTGQTVRIQFGTSNDGYGGITSMYVDDAAMDICIGGPSPTPTPTPLPGTCTERIKNNSFEVLDDWEVPVTAFSAGYSSDNAHTGTLSMRNGIIYAAHNRFSYSDAYQVPLIAAGSSSAVLDMWIYPVSSEAVSAALPERPTAALQSSAALAGDVQYVLLLDSYGNWIDTLLWQRSNAQVWTHYTFDLTNYAGMRVRIQFGVYNDGIGGVTSMYVDDVTLQDCP